MGQGAKTGRGMGFCAGSEEGTPAGGFGRGLGMGPRLGRGRGMGCRGGFRGTPWQQPAEATEAALEAERTWLKQRLEAVEQELNK